MKQTRWLSEFSSMSEYTRLYPSITRLRPIINIQKLLCHSVCTYFIHCSTTCCPPLEVTIKFWGPPGVLGIWGEWLFIFRDLGSTGNYLRGAGEQAHSFGDLGSPAKKQKKIKEKPPFCLIFLKFLLLLEG